MVLSPLALSLPQDTSCSPIMVQKLDVAPQAACMMHMPDFKNAAQCPGALFVPPSAAILQGLFGPPLLTWVWQWQDTPIP